MKKYMCGIDLGGTKINTGIVTTAGEIVANLIVETNAKEGPDAVIQRMIKSVYEVLHSSELSIKDLSGIGIGCPGLIDSWEGVVIEASNLPGWTNIPVIDIFLKEFGIPIRLENDANAAAMGEYLFGSGRGNENFVYVTISTGIGGGVIIDGKLYSGSNSNASEVGHASIDFKGPRCNCGNYGCFELFASGTAMARFANERLKNGEETALRDLADGNPVKAEHVFEAARKGDIVARELLDYEALYLAAGFANIIAFYNPEKISIGGGVASQWDMLSDRVISLTKERALKPSFNICEIVRAELGANVGLLGAAGLVMS